MTKLIISEVERKIAEQKKVLADLEIELKRAKTESPEKSLAKVLHGMLCTQNHTDGCGWFYEFAGKEDKWDGYAHTEYLKKAQKLTRACKEKSINPDDAIEMFKLVKGH